MRRTGSGECFVVRTLTLTPDGAKPIESFEIGQLVLSHDRHEGLVARAVTALQCHRCRVICRIMSAGAWLKGARRTQPIKIGGCCYGGNSEARPCGRQV
jgi:hypothetical protein